jgi:hypothetical protein
MIGLLVSREVKDRETGWGSRNGGESAAKDFARAKAAIEKMVRGRGKRRGQCVPSFMEDG